MHEAGRALVVAPRSSGASDRQHGSSSIARLGRDHSVRGQKSPCRFCAAWRNRLVVCPGRAVSLRSVVTLWDRGRHRGKCGVVVADVMVRGNHRARRPSHARRLARPYVSAQSGRCKHALEISHRSYCLDHRGRALSVIESRRGSSIGPSIAPVVAAHSHCHWRDHARPAIMIAPLAHAARLPPNLAVHSNAREASHRTLLCCA